MSAEAPWEKVLREHFPAYLLPSGVLCPLPREAAARFLQRISGRVDLLDLLLASSALASLAGAVRDFAQELPELARVLPSQTELVRLETDGRVVGHVDVAATLRRRLGGAPMRVVSHIRHRRFDRPENLLVAAVARRLEGLLAHVIRRKLVADNGWAAGFQEAATRIQHALGATVLREIPEVELAALSTFHEKATEDGRHASYELALLIFRALRDGLDADDSTRNARVIADGALRAQKDETRFELAVVIRLSQALFAALNARAPGRWRFHQTILSSDRAEVFDFERDDGTHIRIYYNQGRHLPKGRRYRGVRHYLGGSGVFRPDVSIRIEPKEGKARLVAIEVKLSEKISYLKQGYHEALLYRAEYASEMSGWPNAILVVPGRILRAPRRVDEVIAIGWESWVPDEVVQGLIDGL